MAEVAASVSVAAPAERVWSTLRDLTAMRVYMPGIEAVSVISPNAEGARGRMTRALDGALSGLKSHVEGGASPA